MVKVIGQGHNVKKSYFQGLNIVCLTCDLVVKCLEGQGQSSLGQGQISCFLVSYMCVSTPYSVWYICKQLLTIYQLHWFGYIALAGGLTSTSSCLIFFDNPNKVHKKWTSFIQCYWSFFSFFLSQTILFNRWDQFKVKQMQIVTSNLIPCLGLSNIHQKYSA